MSRVIETVVVEAPIERVYKLLLVENGHPGGERARPEAGERIVAGGMDSWEGGGAFQLEAVSSTSTRVHLEVESAAGDESLLSTQAQARLKQLKTALEAAPRAVTEAPGRMRYGASGQAGTGHGGTNASGIQPTGTEPGTPGNTP